MSRKSDPNSMCGDRARRSMGILAFLSSDVEAIGCVTLAGFCFRGHLEQQQRLSDTYTGSTARKV